MPVSTVNALADEGLVNESRGDWLDERLSNTFISRLFGENATVERLDALVPVLLWIRDRQGRLGRLVPNLPQRLYAQRRGHRNIILKARQVGMTTWIAARFFLATILRPGTVTLQVAHTLESAEQIFRIVHRFLKHLPESVGRQVITERTNAREIAFSGIDSRYIAVTAGNHYAGRGLTVHNLHASEVAQWPGDARETMAALQAGVVPGGNIEIESSANGVGDYFHEEWMRASRGEEDTSGSFGGFVPHFFPWWLERSYRLPVIPPVGSEQESADHLRGSWERLGDLDEQEKGLVERQRLDPEQIQFRREIRARFGSWAPQEFAESTTECFLSTGRAVFDQVSIEKRLRQLQTHGPATPKVDLVPSKPVQVWFEPQPGREYVIGADVAEGRERGDYSAAVVIDDDTGLQCAEINARWPLERFARELAEMGRRYNHALLAVERNNQGHAVLYALLHGHGYPRVYFHPEMQESRRAGWPMNVQTKPQAIAQLGRMLVEAPEIFRSERLLEQCRYFVYGNDGEMGAAAGTHDDLVIAAAIAVAVRAQLPGTQRPVLSFLERS